MFRRNTVLTHPRPLTGAEMEAAAEREKWMGRVKRIENVVAVIVAIGAVFETFYGVRPVAGMCDVAVVGLGMLGWAWRRKTRPDS